MLCGRLLVEAKRELGASGLRSAHKTEEDGEYVLAGKNGNLFVIK
jgi:hypothetical protein